MSMMMPQTIVPLQRKIRLLQNFTRDWAGEVVDSEGLVRLLNANGTQPPLIWCFNAEHEFPALAGALGPDQPVIGLRSLNTVVDFTRKNLGEDYEISRYYAQILRRHFDHQKVWIGGNCQGAAVSAELANAYTQSGVEVSGQMLLEFSSLLPWPGSCHFLFGAESQDFNPFLRGVDPWPLWELIYGAVDCAVLPGGHGEYFLPHRVGDLVAQLHAIFTRPYQTPPPDAARQAPELAKAIVPDTTAISADIEIAFDTDSRFEAAERICAVWLPHDFGREHRHELCELVTWGDGVSCTVRAPAEPGTWMLKLFSCNREDGPFGWHKDIHLAWTILVQ